MADIKNILTYVVNTSPVTIQVPIRFGDTQPEPMFGLVEMADIYNNEIRIEGEHILTGIVQFVPASTPMKGMFIRVHYRANLVTNVGGGIYVSVFGYQFTDRQALSPAEIDLYYNGAEWEVVYKPTFSEASVIESMHIAPQSVTENKIANAAITSQKIAYASISSEHIQPQAVLEEHIADMSVSENHIKSQAVTQTKIADEAVRTFHIADLNVTNSKLAQYAVTPSKIDAAVAADARDLEVNFADSGSLNQIRMPYKGFITGVFYDVVSTIGGSNGVITPKGDDDITIDGITVDIPMGTSVGTSYYKTPTGNNLFNAGDILKFQISGASSGKVKISLLVVKIE